MLKVNAGSSREVGEPNYGSRRVSVKVELQLEPGLIGDPDALLVRIKSLFDLARRSVDEGLNGHQAGRWFRRRRVYLSVTSSAAQLQPP